MTPAQQNFLDSLRRYIVSRFDRLEAKLDAALAAKEITSEQSTTTTKPQPNTTGAVGRPVISGGAYLGNSGSTNKSGPVAGTLIKKGGK